MNENFLKFRELYPSFSYDGYSLKIEENRIKIKFDFSVDGLCEFHPTTEIDISNLKIVNAFDSKTAEDIVFSLGMVEAVSYWKACCSPTFKVKCGYLDSQEILWWKKLYFGGLGEFFFRNNIETDENSFMDIVCEKEKENLKQKTSFKSCSLNLIPVGGGKDSNVTMELLRSEIKNNYCFTVNNQGARTESAAAAGYDEDRIVRTYRTIDKELLALNSKGFLNGHTPFSAIVAFLSYYCSFLIGGENIVLSNEASANEGNIKGSSVNHQYSKSYEFEKDFNEYCEKRFSVSIKYFSLLRCFNELQIAKQFSSFKKFHSVFKSCNVGSKKNIWCCNCAKCLFVYIILSPFIESNELEKIFGCNMLEMESMKDYFDGLVGFSDVKPFECIGTNDEVNTAVQMTVKKYQHQGVELPMLLEYYKKNYKNKNYSDGKSLLGYYNEINNIPEKFIKFTEEMYRYVSTID